MRIFKSIMLGLAMIGVCSIANAKTVKGTEEPLTENYVISTYVAAVTQGVVKDIDRVIDNDATFSSNNNKEVTSLERKDVIANLKANAGVKQECTATSAKVKETGDGTVYQIDMKYSDHVRTDMVTIVEGANGWKVTDVTSSFK